MTAKEHAQAAKIAAQGTWYGYKIRPHSPRWNEIMRHLDAIIAGEPEPPPPPPPPPPPELVAPRTYNKSAGGDARFCTAGLPRNEHGQPFDKFSTYDENGLSHGGRDPDRQVPGLKPSNEMDGRGPCDPYGPFPPWPAESYLR